LISNSKIVLFVQQKNINKYLKNVSWLLVEKLLRIFFALFVGIWLTKYLGPFNFGKLNYALSFVGILAALSNLGLDSILVRDLLSENVKKEELLHTTFLLKFLGAILLVLITVVIIFFVNIDISTSSIILIIAFSTFFQTTSVVESLFQSLVLSKYVVIVNITTLIITNSIRIYFILNNYTLISFVWLLFFESAMQSFGLIVTLIKKVDIRVYPLLFKSKLAVSLLFESWPFFLSGIVVSIYMRVDQLIINYLIGTKSVGIYAAAVRLSEAWYFLPIIIANSFYPALISAKKRGEFNYEERLISMYKLMALLTFFVAIPMTFLSDVAIKYLYGNEFLEAGAILKVHIWTGLFVFIGVVFNMHLTIIGESKKSFYRTFLGAFLNIFLNFIFIPIFGIIGSAYATLISQMFSNYFYDLFDYELRSQFYMKTRAIATFFKFKF
jgi:O-antigen/teichoic acid export membrane protein